MFPTKLISLLASVTLLPIASATAGDLADTTTSPFLDQGNWGISVGGFGGFAPAYEGSDVYRFVGYPRIIPRYYSDDADPMRAPLISFRGLDDIRIAALRVDQFSAGPVLGYNFGRKESDAELLRGMGDLDGGLNVGAFTSFRMAPFYVDAAYVRQVTGQSDAGYTIRLGAGWEEALTDRLTGRAYLSTAYASDAYMDTNFSVTPAQASASAGRLSAFDAGAGFKNISLEVGTDYKLTERWTLSSKLGYSHLIGDAASSPITASESQFSGGLGLTYTFGRTR